MSGRQHEANEASTSDENIPPSADSLADAQDSRAVPTKDSSADKKRSRQKSAQVKVKIQAHLNKGYRELLNTTIQELTSPQPSASPFATSLLGHTLWRSDEKEALFHQLCLSGAGDLPSLQRAVGSKSELQIRSYLLQLQKGLDADRLALTSRRGNQQASHPSAFEISEDSEHALNDAAHALAAQAERHNEDQEQQMHGKQWLISEDVADEMDLHYSTSSQSLVQEQLEANNDRSADIPLATLDPCESHLLRPSSFLHLSRSLFMNNSEDQEMNWHFIDKNSADPDQPAIYKSALTDLHNVAVNITRRMVQATLFQATSRLRAEDSSRKDWTPSPAVRQLDVRAAMSVLNMPLSRTYWATAARRCKVHVYSESKKYKDGRPSTKNGCLLSYDEVEEEMGVANLKGAKSRQKAHVEPRSERSVPDEDIYTSEGSSSDNDNSDELQEITEEYYNEVSRKRKRAPSPESAAVAEDRRLEALDQLASAEEEQRILDLLGLPSPDQVPKKKLDPPTLSNSKAWDDCDLSSWRERLQYEAEWERPYNRVKDAEFDHMELRRQRKRRRTRKARDDGSTSKLLEELSSGVESVPSSETDNEAIASNTSHDTSENDET